jgi:hypothetical protein
MKIGIFIDQVHFAKIQRDIGKTSIDSFIKLSNVEWISPFSSDCDAILITEKYINDRRLNGIQKPKVLFISEPFETNSITRSDVLRKANNFDLILTFDSKLLELIKHSRNYIVGGTFFGPNDLLKPCLEKNLEISTITTDKCDAPGHRLRNEIVSIFGVKYDLNVFGKPNNPFNDRNTPYSGASFTIVVENVIQKSLFTEKIIDPLLLGVTPIYWGAPNIGDFFDHRGILSFVNLFELDEILRNIKDGVIQTNHAALEHNKSKALFFLSKELNVQNVISNFFSLDDNLDINKLGYGWDQFLLGKKTINDCIYGFVPEVDIQLPCFIGLDETKYQLVRSKFDRLYRRFTSSFRRFIKNG